MRHRAKAGFWARLAAPLALALLCVPALAAPMCSHDSMAMPAPSYPEKAPCSPASGPEAVAAAAPEIFNDSYVHTVRITINGTDWFTRLYESHDKTIDDPYFKADFECDGTAVADVGFKMKGYTSFKYYPGEKKSFRLDFNAFDGQAGRTNETTFQGLRKLNLNNNYLDPTMMREKLLYDFARKYVPSPRSSYAAVYINGEYWGLYSAVEGIDATFARDRYGPMEDGNLWATEMGCDLSYLGEDREVYNGSYSLLTNAAQNNWSALVELCRVLNNTPSSGLPAALEPIFDVQSWLYAMAIDNLFINLDSYIGSVHNYYLYHRDDTGRLTHLLWDANMALGTYTKGMTPMQAAAMAELDPFWFPAPQYGETEVKRPLMEKLWAVPQYRQEYLQAMARLLREGFDRGSMEARIGELAGMIRPFVRNDTKKMFTEQEFEKGMSTDLLSGRTVVPGLLGLVEARAGWMKGRLGSLANKSDLRINELMPLNGGAVKDESAEADPWVELHNPGPGTVNTSGIYLSDSAENPGKWALPSMDIADGEYVLLWADGEQAQGALHAPFLLSSSSGTLVLSVKNGTAHETTDSVRYPALESAVSYGRCPDWSGDWAMMRDHTTPGAANRPDDMRAYINEFMAANQETIADPDSSQNDFPDWVEVYNGGNHTLDMTGMYLTDTLAAPTKWRFPAGTSISRGGYLLVWVDNNTDQGPLHAGFRLDAYGDEIALVAPDGLTILDRVAYGEQFADVSYGRTPDGGSSLGHMFIPTPGRANQANPDDHEPPFAFAGGDMTVSAGKEAVLDATTSRDNIGIVSYRWEFVYNGTAVVLDHSVSQFYFNRMGIYSVTLTVTDSGGNTATDTLIVKALKGDAVADASPQYAWAPWIASLIALFAVLSCLAAVKIREWAAFRHRGAFK